MLDFGLFSGQTPPESFFKNNPPVVVMSRGHSGTRVLSWCLSKLGIPMGTSEAENKKPGDVDFAPFSKGISKIAAKSLKLTDPTQLDPALVKKFKQLVYQYYQHIGEPKGAWGWKFPETYLIGPYIEAAFPDAKYFHMVRDGRDIAFKTHATDDPTKKMGQAILNHLGAMGDAHHIQAAKSWDFQVNHFEAFAKHISKERLFSLTFEELCLKPMETASEICSFLKTEMTEECEHYLKNDILPGKVAQYKENPDQEVAEVVAVLEGTAKRLGYLE
ncbi:MAG: sulfotransferase [SAR324 cluster bacterium]|nr:sulfotransferase [SAR324 cluster bacterium]